MSLNRPPSNRSAQVPGHAKPAAALPPFKPASDGGPGKDEKPAVPWSELCLPTTSLLAAGVLSLLCIPPLIRKLNPAPVPSHLSASAKDVTHLVPSIRRLDVSREHQAEFQKLYTARPFSTNSAGADAISAERWLNHAAQLYDGIQTELWVQRLHLSDYPSNLNTRFFRNEDILDESIKKRFLDALYCVQNDPRYAPSVDTNSVFAPYESLPAAWPNISLRVLHSELQEVGKLNKKARDVVEQSSFWGRVTRAFY